MKLKISTVAKHHYTQIQTEEEFEKENANRDFVEREYEEIPDHIAHRIIGLRDRIDLAEK